MDLEAMIARKDEIQKAIDNATNSVYIFKGHMQELDYQMGLMAEKKAKDEEEAAKALESPDENPIE
jgi:hypothetical protein